MKIGIHSIEHKGDLDKEVVWLDVLEDVAQLSHYMICDTTYLESGLVSNELRHVYWFPDAAVKRGDWIALRTKRGRNRTGSNDRGTASHTFYWGLGSTIWNKEGDCAVLFKLGGWMTRRG